MSTRAPVASAPSVPPAAPRACPAASTGLLLCDDLGAVLREAARLPELVVQLRHQDARLVVAGPIPDLATRLHLPTRACGPVVGRAERCPCCDSPGRIAIHDTARRELVQLCALADCTPPVWMDLLLDLLPRSAAPAASFLPLPWTDSPDSESVPDSDPRLAQTLCTLLNRIWPAELRLDLALHAGPASLSIPFEPESGSVARGLLDLRSGDATLQLLLPAIRRLVIVPSGLDPALEIHTRAPGDKLVLRCAAPAWRRALAEIMPDACVSIFS